MMKRLLDLFCGAGGAGVGYHHAGFEVVGVDINPQPHYPFEFHQADVFDYLDIHGEIWREFDVIHASPPCQAFSSMTKGRWKERVRLHPDLIAPLRKLFIQSGTPYVIENVIGAPLLNPIILCGTMFGLETEKGNQLRRHRIFETSFLVGLVPPCQHNQLSTVGIYGGGQHPRRRTRKRPMDMTIPNEADFGIRIRQVVMGINWMTGKELNQAIPPAYTEFLGKIIMKLLEAK